MAASSEKSIFLSALELDTLAARQAYLERACGGDARLRAAVDELLAAHGRAGNVLDSVPEPVDRLRAYCEVGPDQPTPAGGAPAVANRATPDEAPGTTIGSYRLVERIGEGGFGYVFVAEQLQPVRRQVALKVLKPGMDSREVIARFEAERQALALMDHPNIARVFDAGTTAAGRPYFVMELVRGVPITQFCAESELSISQCLDLFIHVCNAVQHAHQKGVIHRDLKPPNVLVTLHDGTPVVKVIDFGVAKAIGEPLTAKTIYTRSTQVIGTPLYMSPEQIELSGLDVDTRSDIYSLGVLLYEMLTGLTPFDERRLDSVSFDELRRIICDEEPPRPSARLTTVRQCASPVRTDRELIARTQPLAVRGDLDWIVMKALEKDRNRRYATAAELAVDVRRYLQQEPVAARPPSPLYRFGKFARRNKVLLTSTALVLAALVIGTGVSTWLAILATRARAEADTLRHAAVESAEHLKQANVLLDNARANADSERWATAYAQYSQAAALQPGHYAVWTGRGALFVRLGLWERAAADYARALELGAPANNPGWWGVPQLCAYAGDLNACRSAVDRMRRQLADSSDSLFRVIALRGCLVIPESATDPSDLLRRAESLLVPSQPTRFRPDLFHGPPPPRRAEPPSRPPGRDPGPFPGRPRRPGFGGPPGAGMPRELRCYVVGLAHLRAGNAELAVEHLRQATRTEPGRSIQFAVHPALAMAQHSAGRTREARATLAEADTILDKWLDAMEEESVGVTPVPWLDYLEFLVLHREATRLVTGSAAREDVRLAVLRQRALKSLEP